MSAATGPREPADRLERRKEIRDQLLVAMEEVLGADDGYAEPIVDRLVALAGIGRSTFYKYFTDKGDLFGAWCELISEQVTGASAAWLSLRGDISYEQLRGALGALISAYRPHAALMATVYDVAHYDTSVAGVVREVERRAVAELAEHIEIGQRGGWIDPELLSEETAAWLSWLGERGRHHLLRVAGDDDDKVARLVDAYTWIVWCTLYAFAPARAGVALNGLR